MAKISYEAIDKYNWFEFCLAMRSRDEDEIREQGYTLKTAGEMFFKTGILGRVDSRPAAAFAPTEKLKVVWGNLLTTPVVEEVPITYARMVKQVSQDWTNKYNKRLLAQVSKDYTQAARLLEIAGYKKVQTILKNEKPQIIMEFTKWEWPLLRLAQRSQ